MHGTPSQPPDAIDFGRLIAGRFDRVRIQDGTGHYRVTTEFPDAPPVTPWAVQIFSQRKRSARTLPLDFDAHDGGDQARQAQEEARAATELLDGVGVGSVDLESGPLGGRHVFARFKTPVPGELVEQAVSRMKLLFPTLDIRPSVVSRVSCIRPPLSVHRLGGTSRFLRHDPQEAFEILQRGNRPKALERLLAVLPELPPRRPPGGVAKPLLPGSPRGGRGPAGMSKRLRHLVETGEVDTRDQSRSGKIQSLAFMAYSCGYTEEEAFELAMSVPPLAARLDEESDPERYFHLSWADAEASQPDPAFAQARIITGYVSEHVQDLPMPSVMAVKMYVVMLTIAEKAASLSPTASFRQIGELAGVSESTAHVHCMALAAEDRIKVADRGFGDVGTRWEITAPPELAPSLADLLALARPGRGGTSPSSPSPSSTTQLGPSGGDPSPLHTLSGSPQFTESPPSMSEVCPVHLQYGPHHHGSSHTPPRPSEACCAENGKSEMNPLPSSEHLDPVEEWSAALINHAVWTRGGGGLGTGGLQMYRLLLARGEVSTPDVVAATRSSRSRVYEVGRRLREQGLVHLRRGLWRAVPADEARLDEIAAELGVDGRAARLKARHGAERDRYRDGLDEYRRAALAQAEDGRLFPPLARSLARRSREREEPQREPWPADDWLRDADPIRLDLPDDLEEPEDPSSSGWQSSPDPRP